MVEHLTTWPVTVAVDRVHPARNELPDLWGNGRAFAQATWRHLLFGIVLGELERRFNAPDDTGVPPYDHVVVLQRPRRHRARRGRLGEPRARGTLASDRAGVAQLVEHRSCKAGVTGSSPVSGSLSALRTSTTLEPPARYG